MQAIATLRLGQSREIGLQIFLEAPGHLYYFDPLTTNQLILICLIVHSDQVIKLRKACAVPLCILAAFLPMEATPGKTHFYKRKHLDIYKRKHLVQHYVSFCDKRE